MKKFIAMITAACIIGGAVPAMESWAPNAVITASAETVASGTCGDSLKWTLDSLGTLNVTGTGAMYNWTDSYFIGGNDVVYPSSDGDVTPWFDYKDSIKKIVIGNGVTTIGESAYLCCFNVTSVYLPEGLTAIEGRAFEYCKSLKSVDIPDTVKGIYYAAFSRCKGMTTIDIGNGVESIYTDAFCECESLTSLDIPASVSYFAGDMFDGCKSLKSINVDANNQDFASVSGVLLNKDMTRVLCYPAGKTDTGCTVPNNVKTIEPGAFEGNLYLKTVKLQSPLWYIGDDAFRGCDALTSISIPDSVTFMGSSAFEGCDSLKAAVLPKSLEKVYSYTFAWCTSLEMVMVLNEDCEINDDRYTICNSGVDYTGSIVGYKGSTAQSYAENYGYTFEPIRSRGDVNADAHTDSSDAALILRHYAAAQSDGKGTLTYYTRNYIADCNTDGAVDSSDAAMLLKYYAENQAK